MNSFCYQLMFWVSNLLLLVKHNDIKVLKVLKHKQKIAICVKEIQIMTKSDSKRPNKLLYRSSTGDIAQKRRLSDRFYVCKEFEIEWLQDHGKCYKDSCEFQGCDMRPKCGYLHCTYDIIFACHGTTVANKCIVRDITDTFLYTFIVSSPLNYY